jgi:selenocysteine lyase/cysteine desulfurase
VQALGCDFLACSAYKFFGPHVGVLWGRRELLESLPCYKVRPAPNSLPGKWMTGTQNHEGLAGVVAAVDYLASLDQRSPLRRQCLAQAITRIQQYEQTLSRHLLAGLADRPRIRVLGVRDLNRLQDRVPTVSIVGRDASPQQLAQRLARKHIYCWAGNSYALEVSEQLGLEPAGFLRLGLVHYNTSAEIDTLLKELDAAC